MNYKSFFWLLISAVALLMTFCNAHAGPLPDPARTPGAINPAVTPATLARTICKPGWTATIRPPASYTTRLKQIQIEDWGLRDTMPGHYEEDHLISLQLGGDPIDPKNLWPQPYAGRCGARVKDVIETKLKRLVCAGQISLRAAQTAIRRDWVKAYIRHVGPLACTLRRRT